MGKLTNCHKCDTLVILYGEWRGWGVSTRAEARYFAGYKPAPRVDDKLQFIMY